MRCALKIMAGTAALSIGLSAQPLPDVTGRWIAVEPESVRGHELHISRNNSILQLEQLRLTSAEVYDSHGRRIGSPAGERERSAYRLDGEKTVAKSVGQPVHSWLRAGTDHVLLTDLYQETRLTVQRKLSLDDRGRLVLEQRRPAGMNDDPALASGQVLIPSRIVFEKR